MAGACKGLALRHSVRACPAVPKKPPVYRGEWLVSLSNDTAVRSVNARTRADGHRDLERLEGAMRPSATPGALWLVEAGLRTSDRLAEHALGRSRGSRW